MGTQGETVMVVMRWQPIVEFGSLQRQIDQLFEDLTPNSTGNHTSWIPPVEIKELPEALTVRALLPGIHQDDLDIQVTRESVLIAGEYRQDAEATEGYSRSEFTYGKFRRVVALPMPVDNASVQARLEHGVLTLTLPKAPEVLNRVVKVNLSNTSVDAE
jgi:HSP20 family protein